MVVVVAITITISIKCKYIYNTHWQASDLPRLFLSARGGSLSVGGVVLRSDALASALTITVTQGRELMVNGVNIGWEVLAQKEIG